jgi:hypothetical protein
MSARIAHTYMYVPGSGDRQVDRSLPCRGSFRSWSKGIGAVTLTTQNIALSLRHGLLSFCWPTNAARSVSPFDDVRERKQVNATEQ